MSQPARPLPAKDRRALQPFLKSQIATDRQLLSLLKDAQTVVDSKIRALESNATFSGGVNRAVLGQVRREILREEARVWRRIGEAVKGGVADAAAAAVESNGLYTEQLFSRAGHPELFAALQRSQEASARAGVEVAKIRAQYSARQLSQRVYHAEQWSNGVLDRTINAHLATGSSARELAAAMRQFINPNVQGGVRYAAMRLGRTELNNAFHAQQVKLGAEEPWVERMKWNISGSHPRPDSCDDYAGHSDGPQFEDGTWVPEEVPGKPHPQCLCFVTPVTVDLGEFIQKLNAGAYDSYIGD
jgi:hypothetical protein